MMKVQELPMAHIRITEDALRACDTTREQYIALKDSIRKSGVLQNIMVLPKEFEVTVTDPKTHAEVVKKEKGYIILNGLQRFTAVTELAAEEPENPKWKTILAGVIDSLPEVEAQTLQLTSNFNVDMKPSEIASHLNKMLVLNPSWTLQVLAKQISQTTTYIEKYLGLRKLDAKILKMLDEGLLPITNAQYLSKLPPEERENFLDRARTEPTNEFAVLVNNRLAELKQATSEGRAPKPEGFVATPKLRKAAEIVDAREKGSINKMFVGKGLPESELIKHILDWCLELDENSVAAKRKAWEEKKAESDAKVRARQEKKLEGLGIVLTPEQKAALAKK